MAPQSPVSRRSRRATRPWWVPLVAVGVVAAFGLLAGSAAAGPQQLDEEAALAIARVQWFEGIPDERIAPLSAEAVDALLSLLGDPAEQAAHANAITLLGRAGGAGAYEAVAGFAAAEPEGEVDGAVYRSRLAIPFALGYLARTDDRALGSLLTAARRPASRGWHHRQLDGARVGRLLQINAVTGLALSGRIESASVLDALALDGGPTHDSTLAEHAREMQSLHAEIRDSVAEAQ